MLFVHWNSSLAVYFIFTHGGDVIIAIVLAPAKPRALSQYMIHSDRLFSLFGFLDGVQSTMKSART
jgi:hypothetical protein